MHASSFLGASLRYQIDGITVKADVPENEAREYAKRAPKGCTLVKVETDGEWVNLTYCDKVPFERIRRITGYLVGTLDRFNDAKRAEERDRVKHA